MRASHPSSTLAQWRGALELTRDALDQVTARIHEFHRAISDLPFAGLNAVPGAGAGSAPVRALHDGITDGVYQAVRLTGTALLDAASALLRQAERSLPAPPAAPHRGRDLVTGALAGFVGDHAAVRRNPLMPRLGFYHDGQRLAPDRAALTARFPTATPRLAIFVHGLACTEHSWALYQDPARPETQTYAARLQGEFGYSPLFVRYNTGLHISANGRRLAREIGRLVAAWPQPVTEIVLIGHSMGGLVIRAAAAQAQRRDEDWVRQVRHLICLGSPHRGAPLEQAVDALTGVLGQFELSRPWGRVLEARSVGIRDLKHGATSDADWRDGRRRRWQRAQALERLPWARHHFIGSSIGVSADDPLGRFAGDGLVRLPSSVAVELADADAATLFRLHHMQLLNHPEVYARIRAALNHG
ncbi:alpha/beta hydrolase [Fontimonas sp. SYSU GA230001]|uniref:esterase/lipase family protein n=1 Tax=Fontimonas sp. SYSU GA230001 TaxID=3142450 RepID=UPI0032B55C09